MAAESTDDERVSHRVIVARYEQKPLVIRTKSEDGKVTSPLDQPARPVLRVTRRRPDQTVGFDYFCVTDSDDDSAAIEYLVDEAEGALRISSSIGGSYKLILVYAPGTWLEYWPSEIEIG